MKFLFLGSTYLEFGTFNQAKNSNIYILILTCKKSKNKMPLIELKSAKITKKGQIAIPKDVRLVKGFEEGSKIAILVFEDRVELRPMDQISEKIAVKDIKNKKRAWKWKKEERCT